MRQPIYALSNVRSLVLFAVLVLLQGVRPAAGEARRHAPEAQDTDASRRSRIARVAGEVFSASETKENLRILCDEIGGRLSGSESGRAALDFADAVLKLKSSPDALQVVLEKPPLALRRPWEMFEEFKKLT
jgi:hypothetical protein